MAFQFSEQHIADYYHHGYTIFRAILPPCLIADLRRMTDVAREIARRESGPQAQRLQPLTGWGFDLRAFENYAQLPELNDAICRVLTPQHTLVASERATVLFEPGEMPYCTAWHRDITENSPGVDAEEFRQVTQDATFFTQSNCPLYTDTSTWYVPGSDGRRDIPGEPEAARKLPEVEGKSYEERERLGLEYCLSMPGAVQFILEPGDFALYRPNAWHIGNYAPYRKRASIHDSAWKPEVRAWYQRWDERRAALAAGNT